MMCTCLLALAQTRERFVGSRLAFSMVVKHLRISMRDGVGFSIEPPDAVLP